MTGYKDDVYCLPYVVFIFKVGVGGIELDRKPTKFEDIAWGLAVPSHRVYLIMNKYELITCGPFY